jgi:hypothetical protein
MYEDVAKQLPYQMRLQRAMKCKIYLADTVNNDQIEYKVLIPPANVSNSTEAPPPSPIWYAQMQYWIAEDVCHAIAQTNQNAKNVTESYVKKLIRLDIPDDSSMYARAVAPGLAAMPAPKGAKTHLTASAKPDAAFTEPLKTDYRTSPTGRVSNPMYDVVHYTLEVDIDSRYIEQFLLNLSNNRYITVRSMSFQKIQPSDPNDPKSMQAGYIYGDAPMADLTVDCEQLFMRDWTTKLMPPEVAQSLGIPLPTEAGSSASASFSDGTGRLALRQ